MIATGLSRRFAPCPRLLPSGPTPPEGSGSEHGGAFKRFGRGDPGQRRWQGHFGAAHGRSGGGIMGVA